MEEIDFVITWVDGADKEWRKNRRLYTPGAANTSDDGEVRYRDWGLLKYWFRGVEAFAPWVRRVYFVTCGHRPSWLNLENEKLHVVAHEDFMDKDMLPTFNSNSIEVNFHRIQGLSEHFVYFNDDVFLISKAKKQDFFREGKPCDMLALQPVVANPKNPVMTHIFTNNALLLCRHFDKRKNMRQCPRNYFRLRYPLLHLGYNLIEAVFPLFTGFYTAHGAAPFLKSVIEEVWEQEEEEMLCTSHNRFRDASDVNLYVFREWAKLSGRFHPVNIDRGSGYFETGRDNSRLLQTILSQKKRTLCINDADPDVDFERAGSELREAFSRILPQKSSFER